ncbi:hypothetical protein SC661_14095 [Legionella pneumophila serogroup 1]
MSKASSLSEWFSERPQWLQIMAIRLLQQSELTDEDISEFATLCQQEASGEELKISDSFPISVFPQDAEGILRLCSISEVEGINALAPKKPLEFGKGNMAIVYGNNGSGKTGYVRLLKHVCGARYPGTLHRNVYKPNSSIQKACISFEQNAIPRTHTWSGEGICDDLSSIQIFDTSYGKVFVNSEDEVSYEPPVLSFFSSLILASEKVTSALDLKSNNYLSKKPSIPADKKRTPEGIWYEAINENTSSQDIEKHCEFASIDDALIETLQQRLAEQEPAEKAKQLRKQKQHIDSLVNDAQKYLAQLSTENYQRIIAAKKKLIVKKTAADKAAKKVFSSSELPDIGSEIWKELWEVARNYSVQIAYKDIEYPNVSEDSRCVLCHQTLSQEAKDRFISFEGFVQGEMQKAATDAAEEYEAIFQTFETLPTSEILETKIDATSIPQNRFSNQVTEFFTQLQVRKDQLQEIDSEDAIPEPLPTPEWIVEANDYSKSLGELAEKFEEDAKCGNRDDIIKQLNSLQTRKWLSENRIAIDEEVNRLKNLKQIQEAKKLTNTKILSQKKGELSQILITNAFVQRFNDELKALNASQIKVELVQTRVAKGRVFHKLQLRGATQSSLVEVLSEGENRIVSIAAFLADVTAKINKAPLIFDDPISSLDQNYEESVVKRLIDLSKDKQIIVFTHRLSLLGTIKHFSEKRAIKPDVVSIRSADWGVGEPASIPLSQSDIKTALNILINKRYQDAKNAKENGEFEHAEILLKSICSDFRTLVERSIENDLLCGIVQRFQRPVHTLKLKDLSKLKESDCNLLDLLMTKYSGFEHSQPEESPVELPMPDELLDDMKMLLNWREEYANRTVRAGEK